MSYRSFRTTTMTFAVQILLTELTVLKKVSGVFTLWCGRSCFYTPTAYLKSVMPVLSTTTSATHCWRMLLLQHLPERPRQKWEVGFQFQTIKLQDRANWCTCFHKAVLVEISILGLKWIVFLLNHVKTKKVRSVSSALDLHIKKQSGEDALWNLSNVPAQIGGEDPCYWL